jgi:hypothetical protein
VTRWHFFIFHFYSAECQRVSGLLIGNGDHCDRALEYVQNGKRSAARTSTYDTIVIGYSVCPWLITAA